MTDVIETIDLDILGRDAGDEALEAAAITVTDKAGGFTLAFCSGLDTCPA